jgi:ADP-heptose:LPS heptosyltransferase
MSDQTIVVTPEELDRLADEWRRAFFRPRSHAATPLFERLRNRLRVRYFRHLAREFTPQHHGMIDASRVRRVLLVRYDALGDYICTTPLIQWLRDAIPGVEIDMITSFRNDPVIRLDPNISQTFPIDYQFKLVHPANLEGVRAASQRDYDVVIGLALSRMTKLASLVTTVAPRAEKIALRHHNRQGIYEQVFTWSIDREPWVEHWAETFLRTASETIRPAGELHPPYRQYIVIEQGAWQRTREFMRSEGLGFGGFSGGIVLAKGWEGPAPEAFEGDPYIVANISAYTPNRQWSPASATDTVREMLRRDPETPVYVTGSPAELDAVKAVVRGVAHPRCRLLSLKLTEFFCFLGGAAMVITPDTATAHIAAAHRRPVVGLYGEKIKAVEWHPFGTEFVLLISPSERTINMIPSKRIVDAVESMRSRVG